MFLAALDLVDRPWGGLRAEAHGRVGGPGQAGARARQRHGGRQPRDPRPRRAPERVRLAMSSFGDAEVHVVYTARDLARQVPAEWQERVKHRRVMPFKRFVRRVRRHARAQGRAPVLAGPGPAGRAHPVGPRPAARAGAPGHRAATAAPIRPSCGAGSARPSASTPPGTPLDSARRNPSLGAAETLLLRRLNRRLRDSRPRPRRLPQPGARAARPRDARRTATARAAGPAAPRGARAGRAGSPSSGSSGSPGPASTSSVTSPTCGRRPSSHPSGRPARSTTRARPTSWTRRSTPWSRCSWRPRDAPIPTRTWSPRWPG